MALMPDHMRLTETEQADLDAIRAAARVRHERERRAAAARGRKDYPLLPYECSWAHEEQFRRERVKHRPWQERRAQARGRSYPCEGRH